MREYLYHRFTEQPASMREEALLQAYFGAGCTRAELRELALAEHLSMGDRFDVLLILLMYLVTCRFPSDPFDHPASYRRSILLLNDIEHVLSSSVLDVSRMTAFLLLAISQTPCLTIWLNTAYTDHRLLYDIQQRLGYRLASGFQTTFINQ